MGRTNQPTESSVVPPATTCRPGVALARSIAAVCFLNARSSITAPRKWEKSVGSPIESASVLAIRSSPIRSHTDRGDVGPGGGGALLPAVLERTPDQRGGHHGRVRARVGDDEVLAAGLADQPRIGLVRRQVAADGLPELLERRGRPGEVDAGQVRVRERHLGDREPVDRAAC